jgi:hypothetical protein
VGQSQLVVHTVTLSGRQYPMRQVVPVGQELAVAVVHWARQEPLTQSLPVLQSAPVEHVPLGRAWQRPLVQAWPAAQSLSAVQPTTQALLMHQAPLPQSELYVQLAGMLPPPPVPDWVPPPELLVAPPPAPDCEPPPAPLCEPPPAPLLLPASGVLEVLPFDEQ